jgi:hypothetical protein
VSAANLKEYTTGLPSRAAFARDWALNRWVPLYAQASSYRSFVSRPQKLRQPRYALDAWGYEAELHPKPGALEKAMEEHTQFTKEHTFEVSQINRDALREICRLAEANNFDVYFTLCPLYEGALALPRLRTYYDQLVQYLETVEQSSPRFHLLGPFPLVNTAENMGNVDHLTDRGARDFTRLLIDRIRARQQEAGSAPVAITR